MKANFPFVVMVTSLYATARVLFWLEKIKKTPVGPINLALVHKCKSSSRSPASTTAYTPCIATPRAPP